LDALLFLLGRKVSKMNVKQSILKKSSLKTDSLEFSSTLPSNNVSNQKKLKQRASSVKNVRFFGVEENKNFRPDSSDYTDYYYPIPLSASSSASFKSNNSDKMRHFFSTSNPIALRQISLYKHEDKKVPKSTHMAQINSSDEQSSSKSSLKVFGVGSASSSAIKPEESSEAVTYTPMLADSIKNTSYQSSNYYYFTNKSNDLRVSSSYPSPSKMLIKQEKLRQCANSPMREYKRAISSISTYFSAQKSVPSSFRNDGSSSFIEPNSNSLVENSTVNLQTSSPSIALYTYLLDLNKRINRGIKASEMRTQTKYLNATEKNNSILVKPVVFPIIKKNPNITQVSTKEEKQEISELSNPMLETNAIQTSFESTVCHNVLK